MHREYHRWWSPSLHRDMELLEFGHGGRRVIAFPTSKGRFFEWEDRGMPRALAHALEQRLAPPHLRRRGRRRELVRLPRSPRRAGLAARAVHFVHRQRGAAAGRTGGTATRSLVLAGASFGAFHALSIGLRHPDKFNRVLSMSGLTDIRGFLDGYHNETIYFQNPVDFIPNEHDGWRLDQLRRQDIILAVGNGDRLLHQNRDLSGKLWSKGVGNALREWDGFAHDWPVWHKMINMYIGGHD